MHLEYSLFVFFFYFVLDSALVHCATWFTAVPQNQTTLAGSSVVLTCQATPETNFTYSWTLNGRPIENSSRVYQVGSNLHVNKIVKDLDDGDYVCIVTQNSSGARQATPPAKLKVIWFTTASVHLLSRTKSSIIFECRVKGSPYTEIEWFRNSEKIPDFTENVLEIYNPSIKDNGLYRCIAATEEGSVMSKGVYLKLKNTLTYPWNKKSRKHRERRSASGIKIINGPSPITSKEDKPVELTCEFEIPDNYKDKNVILYWQKDGKNFRQINLGAAEPNTPEVYMESVIREDSRVVINAENGSLLLRPVIASDAGEYTCKIEIKGFESISSEPAKLSVIENLKFAPAPTSSKNLELGSIGKVHCKAQGTPSPQITWIREENEPFPENVENIAGTLTFKNVSSTHQGNYICIANNSQGDIKTVVNIKVVVAPQFVAPFSGSIYAHEYETTVLDCQAIGDPKPTIKWDRDSQYLNENNTDASRFKFFPNGTLQITNLKLDDEGRYGCTIGNSAGLKRDEVQLIVRSSKGFITEAVMITVSLAFAYIILVVGLKMWYRYRTKGGKGSNTETTKGTEETGEIAPKNGEIEPLNDTNSKTNESTSQL